MDIKIDKIKILDNIRQRVSKDEVNELMTSIKQNDLLHPIGICNGNKDEYLLVYGSRRLEACKKLGWNTIPAIMLKDIDMQDLIIKNSVENLQRKNISAIEEGRIYTRLKTDYDMTISEIANRFGLSKKRIQDASGLYTHVPEEYRKKVVFFDKKTKDKKGKIPASFATMILDLRRKENLNKEDTKKLFDLSRQDDVTRDKLRIIAHFIKLGQTTDDAKLNADKYELVYLVIPIEKKQYVKLGGAGGKVSKIIKNILSGKENMRLNIL